MTTRAVAGVSLLLALSGCSGTPRALTAPTPVTTPPTAGTSTLVVFTEPRTGFSTSDLHDVQEQTLQLSTLGELVWTADGTRLPGYRIWPNTYGDTQSYHIVGNICSTGCEFVVRFGTRSGERRAYLTVDYGHDNPGTLVDVEVTAGTLTVTQSAVYPPGSPTLSGIVTETTPTGTAPVAGALVYRGVQTGWRDATTDQNGFYSIPGLYDALDTIETRKDGYQDTKNSVRVSGDTRFDIEIVRR
jgi:hypothetical protein